MLSLRESRSAWWARFWPAYRQQCYTGSAFMTLFVLGLVAGLIQLQPELWSAALPVLRLHAAWLTCALPWAVGLLAVPVTVAIAGPYPTWGQHKRMVAFKQIYDQQPEAH